MAEKQKNEPSFSIIVFGFCTTGFIVGMLVSHYNSTRLPVVVLPPINNDSSSINAQQTPVVVSPLINTQELGGYSRPSGYSKSSQHQKDLRETEAFLATQYPNIPASERKRQAAKVVQAWEDAKKE